MTDLLIKRRELSFDTLRAEWWFGVGFGIINNYYYDVNADAGKFHSHTVTFVFPFMLISMNRFTVPKTNTND